MRAVVLGAGPWGCALAALLNQIGHEVALWEIDPREAARLGAERTQPYLGIALAPDIEVTDDLRRAIAGRALVVLATPSEHVRATLAAAAPALGADVIVACAAKGLERGSRLTMDRVIAAAAPTARLALLSGPTFAKEIAAGLPGAVVVATRAPRTSVAPPPRSRGAGCASTPRTTWSAWRWAGR